MAANYYVVVSNGGRKYVLTKIGHSAVSCTVNSLVTSMSGGVYLGSKQFLKVAHFGGLFHPTCLHGSVGRSYAQGIGIPTLRMEWNGME